MRRCSSAAARPTRSRPWCWRTRPTASSSTRRCRPGAAAQPGAPPGRAGGRPHGLILDIFAQRARSHEGKLQVELAPLQYLATRLVRRWSHLERQQGGIGTRGGPGEAQIELDRRMIGERIKSVKARLEKVKRQRDTQRKARARGGTFRVSLVGYTNAGKSTSSMPGKAGPMRPTSCSPPGHDHAVALAARGAERGVAVRHGGLHPRPAAQAGRGLQGHAAGSGRRRPAAARHRRRQPARCTSSRPRSNVCSTRSVPATCRRSGLQQVRPAAAESAPARTGGLVERPGGLRVPRVWVSAHAVKGLPLCARQIADALALEAGLSSPTPSPLRTRLRAPGT
jgi:hypothetical protein